MIMNRTIKFRAWDKSIEEMIDWNPLYLTDWFIHEWFIPMQFTGLLDKNGKEIYELMELDNKYRVIYQAPKYVLQDISTGDIIDIYDQPTITGEYSPI